ncbi:type II toxin-antitoxin system Phd/YefM family antitoxin [Wenzhouxiangella sp. AB-CW3]|uniref:type II toxin-antitoxin system Phd/YefM family antitoxin n=1 Tax=Wenzhouxiangella sp. AB-CW3 TaxID=2771012 RepID=UPI00168A889B|nr:type II toxin-antitoxin system Phd/YefM family antitoxin [Wenzhouxiangella sp. AB-CW3]QOC23767.1 type II toxin-antitoxin system Phd/YefM family antitoxin [Wenzhouxiangella sp. AB-CW3]
MENTITAQEIKRRGISAVDEALRHGPVHVIQRNRPRYVILSEEDYRRMVDLPRARSALWNQLLGAANEAGRSREEIDEQLQEERGSWNR